MNTKRFVITLGLGLALVLTLMWMLSSTFDPARAYTDTTVTPPPTIDRVGVTRNRQNVPLKEQIADGQSQTQSGVAPLTFSSADIANGDFEDGQDGSWVEYSSHGWDIILDTPTFPQTPHSGSWAAWLGGELDDVSYISQGVTIPSGASTLSFWNWIDSEDVCNFDFGGVIINDTIVQVIDLCVDNNTFGWVERTVDISAYAGQVVTLQIRVETDDTLFSSYFVDDVTLDETPDEHYTFLPLILRNFWASYFDDFNDPDSGWPTGENEYWNFGYLNGEYQFYLKVGNGIFWMTPGPITGRDLFLPSDYRVEVDIRKVSGGDCVYGLMFGTQYASNSLEGYMVLVNPNSGEFYLDKNMMDGSWTVLVDWTYSSAINQGGGSNHIAVERIGSKIKLYINGLQVANITDSSFLGPERDAGVIVHTYDDPPVDVRFDNFSASQP